MTEIKNLGLCENSDLLLTERQCLELEDKT